MSETYEIMYVYKYDVGRRVYIRNNTPAATSGKQLLMAVASYFNVLNSMTSERIH